ncbi:type II secretion system protein [Campylobacter sp. 19-13652]|uniref:type II secretion system protein n=1 Tax=Campylobacter sp. 19-13652 TaxID=2840180 RepID=UPI001C7876AF|nr:prepilin-type N-terminal cleavage/methylation domain-containing protein [Campylobacter sp. 19-13652]BCX79477.1 hypothetical protein LBC_09390 [Campylobacter sp. 19-13652]
MQRGFTLIELIFVIVILGALAGIATSKFMVSRDDAKIVVAATNVKTLFARLNEYYATQGKFENNKTIADITGVNLPIKIGDDSCLNVSNIEEKAIEFSIGNSGSCSDMWDIDALAQIKNQIELDNNRVLFGGSRIKF